MQKKALVFLAPGFEEIEAVTCIDILRRAGIKVTVAGPDNKIVEGSRDISIQPDRSWDSITEEYDAYILPGGAAGAEHLSRSPRVKSVLQEAAQHQKWIAAICASPAVVLGPFGLLQNKTATCYPGLEKQFPPETTFSRQPVVTDGHLITSRGPATALSFALTMAGLLCGDHIRETVARATLAA